MGKSLRAASPLYLVMAGQRGPRRELDYALRSVGVDGAVLLGGRPVLARAGIRCLTQDQGAAGAPVAGVSRRARRTSARPSGGGSRAPRLRERPRVRSAIARASGHAGAGQEVGLISRRAVAATARMAMPKAVEELFIRAVGQAGPPPVVVVSRRGCGLRGGRFELAESDVRQQGREGRPGFDLPSVVRMRS